MAQMQVLCVYNEMPLAQIEWTVLIGGTGGELRASDSSEVVNSMEERSLPGFRGPEEVHCTLQQEQRERTDSHFAAAQKL